MSEALSNVPGGCKVRIVRVNVGRGLVRRLLQMGLLPGEEVLVKHNNGGVIILEARGTEIGISKGIAMKIEVERI
ncbi:MAG: FeoA family protein [Zestosphaera sp.]